MRPRHAAASSAKRASSAAAERRVGRCRSARRREIAPPRRSRRALRASARDCADHVLGRLVADADQHRGRERDRRVGPHARGGWKYGRHRIARAAHDDEADHRVPEADHDPRQRRPANSAMQRDVERAEPAGASASAASHTQASADRDAQRAQRDNSRRRSRHAAGRRGRPCGLKRWSCWDMSKRITARICGSGIPVQ